MATWNDVRDLVSELAETDEAASRDGGPAFRVRGRTFVWERPLRRADLEALGDDAPSLEPLAAYVPDGVAKDALLAAGGGVYFTTPHFDGYPIVLVHLAEVPRDELEELVVEAWAARAPKGLLRAHLDTDGRVRRVPGTSDPGVEQGGG